MSSIETESKQDQHEDAWPPKARSLPQPSSKDTTTAPRNKPLDLVSVLLGNCLCEPFQNLTERSGAAAATQFVELHGVKYIGLGAVSDELSPRERVYDTLEQLTTRTERLLSIGYMMEEPTTSERGGGIKRKHVETVPLDVWNQSYPNDPQRMNKPIAKMIRQVKNKEYEAVVEDLTKSLETQKAHPDRGNNRYQAGITAHNLGVLKLLTGFEDEASQLFEEAITLKKNAFGPDSLEVALSWDELGIQRFAVGAFEAALSAFREAHNIRQKHNGSSVSANLSMVLNNIACCYFQMGNHRSSLVTLQEARRVQQEAVGSSAQADLDLLHVATVIGNCGYLNLALRQYEEARSLFEEALLIQQSVLDDRHRAIRDTQSNIDFTNAFHS